jgi:filamentous hemagglutinin
MIYPDISRRHIASLLLVSYLAGPSLAAAQVVLNGGTRNDGRRAYVDQTQNGLPKVNIATPNGAGVSHNIYQEFNVGRQGLILNNGANNSNTSLAGWVEGNPNLTAGNEAKMILNEVVGAKPSQLQGFLEVAGKKADVIIANENGVTCHGCGFINTSRVTLTSGLPICS